MSTRAHLGSEQSPRHLVAQTEGMETPPPPHTAAVAFADTPWLWSKSFRSRRAAGPRTRSVERTSDQTCRFCPTSCPASPPGADPHPAHWPDSVRPVIFAVRGVKLNPEHGFVAGERPDPLLSSNPLRRGVVEPPRSVREACRRGPGKAIDHTDAVKGFKGFKEFKEFRYLCEQILCR